MKDSHLYDDIICLPHHVSAVRPQMPLADRAAQFSPFAALTGHSEAIVETARLTEEWAEPGEDEKRLLDERLRSIRDRLADRPEATFTYFRPDEKKRGGAYRSVTGSVVKIDEYERRILLEDGSVLDMDYLCAIEGALF